MRKKERKKKKDLIFKYFLPQKWRSEKQTLRVKISPDPGGKRESKKTRSNRQAETKILKTQNMTRNKVLIDWIA